MLHICKWRCLIICGFVFSTVKQQEKVNRAMILAPIVGIVLNLGNATCISNHSVKYDMATTIVGVDTSDAIIANFQYLVHYNWVSETSLFSFKWMGTYIAGSYIIR